MEKCGKHFCANGNEIQRATSKCTTEIMRANDSTKLRVCSACAGDYEDPDRTVGDECEELLDEEDDVDSQDKDRA